MPRDMHYTNGQWTPIDVLADLPNNGNVDDYLTSLGWEEYFTIGADTNPMHLKTWQHVADDGTTRFLLEVNDVAYGSPYVQVDTFPDLMDLMARWAPVVQAASMTYLLNDLTGIFIDGTNGLVERIAARARYGAEEMYEPLRREFHRNEQDRRLRAAKAREERDRLRAQQTPPA